MEQEQIPTSPQPTEDQPQEETAVEPTKSVKNFWERLDEVFALNVESAKMRDKVEQLLEEFPETSQSGREYSSFIFQPERIAVTSADDVTIDNTISDLAYSEQSGHVPAEYYSSFRIRLNRALVNVKSIQLLSAVIPNAVQNIPDDQLMWFYYKIPKISVANPQAWNGAIQYGLGDVVSYTGNYYYAWQDNINNQPDISPSWYFMGNDEDRPNYYELVHNQANCFRFVFLNPTFSYPPEKFPVAPNQAQNNCFNRTFQDYNDLVGALNECAQTPSQAYEADDCEFIYNQTLNKIQFKGNDPDYYYLPCGNYDPYIQEYLEGVSSIWFNANNPLQDPLTMWSYGYTLNMRLGFTWNGKYIQPGASIYSQNVNQPDRNSFYYYLRPCDPFYLNTPYNITQDILTANSYADLVNTSCVRVYADMIFGSTQETSFNNGLLSIVPVSANNLGVGFYQNNFDNPLTKVPKIITEIGFRMVNDLGKPYYLPNSANVLLELAISYK